ncbi:MAG TPA: zinc ribbon domain-containing protein [Longimicrobiales bacterium]
MNDDTVVQLHRTLVDALRRTRPAALNRPVTVAEIYQDLVPYKTARTEIGFDMNADYEHTLLRLLAGEGDLARIEPREVRDKLRMELESPNPDVGLFRNYAACDVWVNLSDARQDEPTAESEPAADDSWEEEFLGADDQAEPAPVEPESEAAPPPFEIAEQEGGQPPLEPASAHETYPDEDMDAPVCGFCGADLPGGRIINFCPFCGTDQSQQPCPSCGEMLDPLWRYCISCGARARPLGDHVN